MITPEDFLHLKTSMRRLYDSIRSPIHCRCLNQQVYFNAKGFHHLLYDGSGRFRGFNEAMSKLTLVPLIILVIKTAVDCSYEKRVCSVELWGLEAFVGNLGHKVRVILRRDRNGHIFFWSIMRIK